ncbi:helix-turn-helix domain-containing protein [Jannaschia rubra]|uniref:Anaerobic benzoate catabolism transcriptional regulator n=1 Tax=Jannaschia rubra TaxID=282197 RepID=A0A0M6XN17_9RHOB|nr:helix-turn-helix transcriptional regulator [Jannaschia rubra]CTQ32062.1 anaerobic benzoate catabolism transcriptional regulator [Jannaschia rubra]SFG38540.1 DNA-binding transcriptional regulator, XRE-family HTH domain [Jannaschia rubra]
MLNKALRLVRVYHDLSQVDAAERLGLSKSYVSEIEKGDKNVSMATLQKYSDAFDIPMSSLLLFAERVEGAGKSENVRVFVADKAVKMLDWVSTISDYRSAER